VRHVPPGPPACHPASGCTTCSDEALPMRVVELREGRSLAVCVDEQGARSDVMTDLVEPVAVGDRVLVHAGAALLLLGPDPALHGAR
jgi:hydrogenase assembly chaperone HypC/HupF